MKKLSRNKVLRNTALAISGGMYLSFFSSLNFNPLLKNYLVLLPIQLAGLIYGIYLIKTNSESVDKKTLTDK